MTFVCRDLERALESDDPRALEAARLHAEECAACGRELDLADSLSAAARTLHREWESPGLWPSTVAKIHTLANTPKAAFWAWRPAAGWRTVAAAAALVLALASATWIGWRSFRAIDQTDGPEIAGERLLSDEALAEVERAEAQYIRAIEALTRTAAPKINELPSPLVVNLRERLLAIDAAIADCRTEIERNRFNAHLRRHLLSIYQEKRRTLEQILEQEQNAS
jgi:hypothetical protein